MLSKNCGHYLFLRCVESEYHGRYLTKTVISRALRYLPFRMSEAFIWMKDSGEVLPIHVRGNTSTVLPPCTCCIAVHRGVPQPTVHNDGLHLQCLHRKSKHSSGHKTGSHECSCCKGEGSSISESPLPTYSASTSDDLQSNKFGRTAWSQQMNSMSASREFHKRW